MDAVTLEIELPDEAATIRLGEDIAAALVAGDVLALSGELGAGKTTLARAIIRALAGDEELDVPSPTFTLVQTYDARVPVNHFDLYRLAAVEELDELGFDEAARDAVALIEWPELARQRLPGNPVWMRLESAGAGRRVVLAGQQDRLAPIRRSLAVRAFLAANGEADAHRAFLLGDASTRTYETIRRAGMPDRILMNSPRRPGGAPVRDGKPYPQVAHLAETVIPFVAVDRALVARGVCAPQIYAEDLDQGFLLLERLGSEGVLDRDGAPVAERYLAAAELLAAVHASRWPRDLRAAASVTHRVPDYDRGAMTIEIELYLDWYLPAMRGAAPGDAERRRFLAAWNSVLDRLGSAEKGIVLRDFHSPNIIWRGERRGRDRLGVIDFQDAMFGPVAYDAASLAMDARVSIDPALERRIVEAYCSARASGGRFDRTSFDEAYAIMAAQRNSKILGIFVRLDRRDGKPQYLRHLPRIRDYLGRALSHPALAPVREFYAFAGVGEAVC